MMNKIKTLLLLVLVLPGTATIAQQKVENLVFEGAGIRGLAYAGALAEMENRKLLQDVKRVGGTSAGAITALMLSLNYNTAEITELISRTNFKGFNDGRFLFPGGMNRVKRYFGWYRINTFEKWLEGIIRAKTGNADITFRELKEQGFRDLYTTGTNLTEQKLVLFSCEHTPHMKVKDAVRISMSIPLYFEAVFVDSTGAIVRYPKDKKGLTVMVDGGLVANFPIRLFDSTKYLDPAAANAFTVNKSTLGFRIDRDGQVSNDSTMQQLAPMPTDNLKQYVSAFYSIIIENLNRRHLTPQDWSRTISIPDGKISPRIRRLSKEEVELLTCNGKEAVLHFLAARGIAYMRER